MVHTVWISPTVLGSGTGISFTVSANGEPDSIQQSSIPSSDSLKLLAKRERGNPSVDTSLNMLFELEGRQYTIVPEQEKYHNVIRTLRLDPLNDDIKWSSLMTNDDYRAFIKKLIFDTSKTLHRTNTEYFKGTWRSTIPVFEALRGPFVDIKLLSGAGLPVRNTLEHAEIDEYGMCNKVVYDRNATRTGRMKVVDGINVLTFPKDSRHIFKSSYVKGAIISVDFKSIEARVAWTAGGENCHDDDIYQMLNEKYFLSQLERKVIKIAVLSLLYGQGPEATAREIGCTVENARKFITLVRSKFGVDRVVEELKVKFEMEGIIRNAYGRRVVLGDNRQHIMYNSYVQSTAVDVVLLGLLNIIGGLHPDIRPLFIIHDEIYFDCPISLLEILSKKLKNVCVGLHGMEVRLPITARIISKNG